MAVASADTTPAGVTPSLAETRALAADYNVIPVRETFIDDCQTPVSAFLKLRESGPSFLLESADQGRVGRYSFIGIRPRKVLRWSLGDPGDPYRLTHAELSRVNAAPLPELPPFAGGAVGLFAYDLVRTVEPLGPPNPDPIGLPDLALMLTDALVAGGRRRSVRTGRRRADAAEGGAPDRASALRRRRSRPVRLRPRPHGRAARAAEAGPGRPPRPRADAH